MTTINNVFYQIKQQLSCVQYAQHLGWNIRKSGDRTFSLNKGSNETCLVVFDDFWYDYKTCLGGDVIDLCAIVNHDSDKAGALKELCQLLNIEVNKKSQEWVDYTQNLCNTIQLWHKQLREQDYEYLHSRNITNETIQKFRIGFNNDRIIIPYYKNGYVSFWIGRATKKDQQPKYLKAKLNGLNENSIWGLHTLQDKNNQLIIVEGAFDALSFAQENYNVLSSMGGHFSKEQIKQLITICKNYQEITLCFDSDEAGQSFTMHLAKIFLTNKINFNCALIKNYKDVSEYYAVNKNLNFLNEKQDGLHYLATRTKDQQEFKDFVKSVSRYTAKTTMISIFDLAKNNFSNEWLKTLKQQALSCPTEFLISKEITEKYKLKFHPQLGFFEYENGVWNKKEDEEIKRYISKELGYYATGGKINSICNLIATNTVTTELFNKQPVLNFKNGILLIETGEFKEHNELFMTTIQLNCHYYPEVISEKWNSFLNTIMDNDQKKIELLQEIFGYILFNDCSMQKFFVFIGNGGDGKSKLLEIIRRLFGNENVSTVEMSCLAEPFQRISLLNSIVNLSSETNTDVKNAAQIFKQIVTGDSINACYKGRDFVTFESRAKMILATNEQINTNDVSKGMDRRALFVKFPISFCDEPKFDNEKKADPYIIDKLKDEMPAIFNWIYEGYKRLKQNLKFTETEEQEEIKEEFRELNNPVYNFINEIDYTSFALQSFIATKVLYDHYKDWCRESGRMQMSYINFSRKVKTTVESYFKDRFEISRTNSKKGYTILSPF